MAPISRQETWLRAACLMEATARKPGNVHPEASFSDLSYRDFVLSARASAPWLNRSRELGVGPAIREAVRATRQVVRTNTNLGMLLLLAPLAAVPPDLSLQNGVQQILDQLSRDDAIAVYEAIRLAEPGGLGDVPDQDVHTVPSATLQEVMHLAADRDQVAAQFATGYRLVMEYSLPFLSPVRSHFADGWETILIGLQLHLLAHTSDSLIVRKNGQELAEMLSLQARCLATRYLHTPDWPAHPLFPYPPDLQEFDLCLRSDGNRRNPGTTADLIAATLFAAFREGILQVPPDFQNPSYGD